MTAKGRHTKRSWTDQDDAPELTQDLATRSQITHGGKILRKATGTVRKRGRPSLGAEPKQQVTLRLPRDVIAFFKAGGRGWQSRISHVLQRQMERDEHKSA